MKSKLAKPKHKTLLWWVGLWATVWWMVSGFYLVWVMWIAKDYYIQKSFDNVFYIHDWRYAFAESYRQHAELFWAFLAILAIWLIGGLIWFRALRLRGISYRAGLKDLLFSIR